MNNLFKLCSLFGLSTCFIVTADAMDIRKTSYINDKNFYIKLQGELAWNRKIQFEQDKTEFLLASGGEIAPKMITSPDIGIGYTIPGYEQLSLELGYKRYDVTYKQDAEYPIDPTNRVYTEVNSVSNVGEIAANYTLLQSRWISPYIRLGVGTAANKNSVYMEVYNTSDSLQPVVDSGKMAPKSSYKFSFSGGLGVEASIAPQLKCGIGYNYQNLGTIKTNAQMVSTLNGSIIKPLRYEPNPKFNSIQSNGVLFYLKYLF